MVGSQLRLVGEIPEYEVLVRERASGAVLLRLCLSAPGLQSPMQLAATAGGAQDADSRGMSGVLEPVAGRIDAEPSDLAEALEGWLSDLAARRRARATVAQYGAEVRRAIREMGWSKSSDITGQALHEYMAGSGGAPRWKKGATYNRALCCFRSLCQYLVKVGKLPANPLVEASRATEDGGEGARAATLEEARAMIARAKERELTDGRCRGHRSRYYLLLFSMGMRDIEPGRLEWRRHVFLDDAIPFVLFTREINKNRRLQEIPIPAETADMLREHREEMRRLARTIPFVERQARDTGEIVRRYVSPDHETGMVFPWVPPRATWRKDRDDCEIPAKDRRGRGFTAHSARKFYETWLVDSGLEQGLVDRLMRHAGGVGARYYDGDLKKLCAAIACLPKLCRQADLRTSAGGGQHVENFTITPPVANEGLKDSRHVGNVFSEASTTPTTDSSSPPVPGAFWSMPHITVPSWIGGHAESSEPANLAAPPRGSIHDSDPGMPIPGLINADRNALAELFEALARLLREPAHGRPDRQASA